MAGWVGERDPLELPIQTSHMTLQDIKVRVICLGIILAEGNQCHSFLHYSHHLVLCIHVYRGCIPYKEVFYVA